MNRLLRRQKLYGKYSSADFDKLNKYLHAYIATYIYILYYWKLIARVCIPTECANSCVRKNGISTEFKYYIGLQIEDYKIPKMMMKIVNDKQPTTIYVHMSIQKEKFYDKMKNKSRKKIE